MVTMSERRGSTVGERAGVVLRTRLNSAARTALACTIVGCTTLYSSDSVRSNVFSFPAFSYVTAILIVSDSMLGDVLRGYWHVFCATLQVVPLSIFALWVIGEDGLSPGVAAAVVVVTSFLVAIPESTHIVSKRIAFGQLVIVFVDAAVYGVHTNVVIHPLRVASSTALGAFASLLALLFPVPRLAYFQVKKLHKLYTENASERIVLYKQAVAARDTSIIAALNSQAKPLADTGAKLLESIGLLQEGLKWEGPWLRILNPSIADPMHELQEIETSMTGIEIALSSYGSFNTNTINEELVNIFQNALDKLGQKLEQTRGSFPSPKMTNQENNNVGSIDMSSYLLIHDDLPASFFLSCIQMCVNGSTNSSETREGPKDLENQDECISNQASCNKWMIAVSETLIFACKCSLSLGLAVFFGLIFDRENGYWSGLTIAISYDTGKQAIFTIANARAQGTAMGSVYGVLGCSMFQRFAKVRLIALLPWIIFTSFLRHSRMYGQAGGISAAVGALLILGRRNYGAPKEFAIARLTEAFIGLSCLIFMELLFQPKRAASLAIYHLCSSLEVLKRSTEQQIVTNSRHNIVWSLREKQRHLKSQVLELGKFISYAELEPDFLSLPFPVSCYRKLHRALTKIADLLHFMTCNVELLSRALQNTRENIRDDLELLHDEAIVPLTSSLSCLTDSLRLLEEKNRRRDVEEGKPQYPISTYSATFCAQGKQHTQNTLNSFLECCKEVSKKLSEFRGKDEANANEAIYLLAVGFCSSCLLEELGQVDKGIKELVLFGDP